MQKYATKWEKSNRAAHSVPYGTTRVFSTFRYSRYSGSLGSNRVANIPWIPRTRPPILCLFFWKGIQPAALLIVVQFRLHIKGTTGTKVLADTVNHSLLKNLHCFQHGSSHTHTHKHTWTNRKHTVSSSPTAVKVFSSSKTKYVQQRSSCQSLLLLRAKLQT